MKISTENWSIIFDGIVGLRRVCKAKNMSIISMHILHVLSRNNGEMCCKDIASAVGVTAPVLVGEIDKFKDVNWVQTTPGLADRRKKYVSLTTAGKKKLDDLLDMVR